MAQESNCDSVYDIFAKFQRILSEMNILGIVNQNLRIMRERKQPSSDKINYILGFMRELNFLPDTANYEDEKSDAKSEEFRRQGNSFFSLKSQKYLEALREYNRSICYAESMENISIGLANRSAVFFEMEMFPECLESIRLARQVGHPERLKVKLERREVKCREAMKGKSPPDAFVPKMPEIDLPVNEKIPFLAKCLTLRENSTYGRYVVTEESIPAGTIIAQEEPYCTILLKKEKYMRCAMCLAEVPHLLLPCDNCTQAMFCSEVCREKANKSFHAIECPVIGSLYKIFCMDPNSFLIAFRMVIHAFEAFPDTETMATALEKIDREQKNVFSFDWSKELSAEELYTPMHTLITNECKQEHKYFFTHYVVACLMFDLLKKSSPVFSQRYLITNAADDLLKNVIFHQLLVCTSNGHSLNVIEDMHNEMLEDPMTSTTITIFGLAISNFYSLLNHSCTRNVQYIPLGRSSGIIATVQNIAAGEQLFLAYCISHKLMDRSTRQKEILSDHYFHCQCVACIEDYPLLRNLPQPKNIQLPVQLRVRHSYLETYSVNFAKEAFKECKKFMQKFGHLYPIYQLAIVEDTLRAFLQVIYAPIPLDIREMIRQDNKKFQ